MSKEISKEEAEKKLEQVVNKYNWIEELLSENKDSFLRTYRALHAQLKDDDKLEIEILKKEGIGSIVDDKNEINYPVFVIAHYIKGTKKIIYRTNTIDEECTNIKDNLLYP